MQLGFIMSMIFMATPAALADADLPLSSFTVTNHAAVSLQTVARVSMPVPKGLCRDESDTRFFIPAANVAAQAKVITRHPDGSIRRLMLSFPVDLKPEESVQGYYKIGTGTDQAASMLETGESERITTKNYIILASAEQVRIQNAEGRELCVIKPFGPELADPASPKLEVLDSGEHFVWLRWRMDGSDRSREIDLQVDKFGHIELTHRLQRHLEGNAWTPDFGFQVSATEARPERLSESPVHFMRFDPFSKFADHPELVGSVVLADGTRISVANPLALRQNRGAMESEVSGDGVTIRSGRLEPVDDVEKNGLMIQEGQWRVSCLVISPASSEELAARLDNPVSTHADWRAYDAVYQTGPPLKVESDVLHSVAERLVYAMQMMSVNGDDWGNITGWAPQEKKTQYNSFVRYNHCLYVWEDFFRTGDPRLFAVARDWSENYRNLTVYWGPKEKYYGGGRRGTAWRDKPGKPHGPGTYMVRFDYSSNYLTKGFMSFWLAYEESGDPRFKEAAEAQARWSAENTHCHTGEMRNVGVIADFVKLYEYTGEKFYMDHAVRLWEEFKSKQGDDLLFTQNCKPAVGDHLYIANDLFGYRNPFVKPYIVQYATNSLPYLLKHRPDDKRLRDTIIALNDFMAGSQTAGGGWGYPAPATAGLGWGTEYVHGIMLAHEIEPKESYLDAIERELRPQVQLFEIHGEVPTGINSWESQAGGSVKPEYHLATDRDRYKDFTDGQLRFGRSPDSTVYSQVLLRDYLNYRSEASLFGTDEILESIKKLSTTLRR